MRHLLALAAALGTTPAIAQEVETEEAVEEIVVEATRSGRRVQDEPIRVEVIDREEIEEKLLMQPGNISMVVAETGGLRVQVTSSALGSSTVRVRGLEGRYTQILADGLPLYGSQSGIGILQIAPTDLGQVEVIKGAASAFYGPSALGGVINLVSRKPGEAAQAEFLLNATSRDGQDATAYAAMPLGNGFSGSLTGGLHRQSHRDLDDDGWVDMPGYERVTLRPRLYWEGGSGAKAFLTIGTMKENRRGGTLPGRTVPDGTTFRQDQDSRRLDAGLVAEVPIEQLGKLNLRASGVTQDHRHRFGDVIENDRHDTLLGEVSISGQPGKTSWLVGAAVQRDSYRSKAFPVFDYAYTAPGVFAQVEHDVRDDLTLAGSARVDFHSDYGTRVSPRVSLLYKPDLLTIRASAGRGFFAPTPFVDEIEAAGLSRLDPLRGLKAEVADTASIDVGYSIGSTEFSQQKVDRVRYIFPFPPGPPGFHRNWAFVRKLEAPISERGNDRRWHISMYDCSSIFDGLVEVSARGTSTCVLAPYGPKTVSLAMCLFATALQRTDLKQAPVYYAQPRRYEINYSEGIKELEGQPDIQAYCLKLGGRHLYAVE